MNSSPYQALGAQKYQQVGVQADLESASPHRLIMMLLDGALEKVNLAKGNIQRRESIERGNHIAWAVSIIECLRKSLDMQAGGEISENLDALYDYMRRRLLTANIDNNEQILNEVVGLLVEVKNAWYAVPELLEKQSQARTV